MQNIFVSAHYTCLLCDLLCCQFILFICPCLCGPFSHLALYGGVIVSDKPAAK